MGAAVALTGALTTCTEVRLDGAGPCAFPEIRAEFSAYWTHIINLARASGAHDAVDAASQAVLAVRRAANADGRHLVDNARHLVNIVAVEYRASMPSLVYGTAWKREETERLARQALTAGFVGF